MAKITNITDHRRKAEAIATRLASVTIPKSLTASAKAFVAAQKAYEASAKAADAAQAARDAALEEVNKADKVLDASVNGVVNLLPAAGLGTRQQPLKGFSSKSPSDLKNMAFADEPDEVDRTVKKILAKKPNAAVVKACKAASARAADVRGKLKGFAAKQASYTKALVTRDAGLPALTKSTESLKRHAAVAWEDDPATFQSVFASPSRVESPKKKRSKKAPATPAVPPAPPPAPPPPPATPPAVA